jgi:CheY-like chemotaxis protein
VADTLAETLKTLVARAEQKGLALVFEPTPGLPSQVRGDPGRIRQVLTNLCDNAIKFTAQGSVTVKARCTPVEGDAFELQLSVSDTGVGIAAEKQQGVFDAFQQADTSTTRQFGGTGLGLTICARLVALMGGRIWVESTPGQGSTFHFTVLVQGVAVQEPVLALPLSSHSSAPAAPITTAPLRVLLVEDHPINQKLAMTLLHKWGYETVLAHNGQEAVDLFSTQVWDVVLMDMQMPLMGGVDATRLIRANEPPGQHTPIVAMTANAMESDQQACFDAGMDAHLAKPFNAAGLQAIIERVVAQGLLPNGPAVKA